MNKSKGLTNKQASYLAALQKQLGVPYTGHGLTISEASRLITKLKAQVANPKIAAIEAAPKRTSRIRSARARRKALPNRVPRRTDRESPSAAQLHDLAVLARRAGQIPPQPSRRGDAARELVRLRSESPQT